MATKKVTDIERAIHNYIKGDESSEDKKIVYEWINENPEIRNLVFRDKDLWEASQIGSEKFNEIEKEQWLNLQKRITQRKTRNFSLLDIVRIAALIFLTLGIGWMSHSFYISGLLPNHHTEQKTVNAGKGQIKEIFLADGTHVWLNSDSRLSFPSDFDENNREVNLQGEAFFEVTANKKKPFWVKTQNHTVKVIGTKFNVCEYPESKIIETTLVEGKVKIITGNIIKDLLSGQQSSFNTETSRIKISEKDFKIYTAWKDGRYEFTNESIDKIFKIIERWWDVKIIYPEAELRNDKISGVLKRHKPVEQLFNLVEQLLPIQYEIKNDEIIVKMKK